MSRYRVTVHFSKQEDGLWRAEALDLPGCFADAETVHEALSDVQECAAMLIDVMLERSELLPSSVQVIESEEFELALPLAVEEFTFRRPSRRGKRAQP